MDLRRLFRETDYAEQTYHWVHETVDLGSFLLGVMGVIACLTHNPGALAGVMAGLVFELLALWAAFLWRFVRLAQLILRLRRDSRSD